MTIVFWHELFRNFGLISSPCLHYSIIIFFYRSILIQMYTFFYYYKFIFQAKYIKKHLLNSYFYFWEHIVLSISLYNLLIKKIIKLLNVSLLFNFYLFSLIIFLYTKKLNKQNIFTSLSQYFYKFSQSINFHKFICGIFPLNILEL